MSSVLDLDLFPTTVECGSLNKLSAQGAFTSQKLVLCPRGGLHVLSLSPDDDNDQLPPRASLGSR